MGEETKILQQFSYKKIDNFINNEEHDSKIFIQKYLYNKVKIELHYSIARITRHVKFKARHVLILRKRRKTRTNNCFLTKNKQCTLFLAVVVSEFFSFFLFHLTYSHICIGTEGEKKKKGIPLPNMGRHYGNRPVFSLFRPSLRCVFSLSSPAFYTHD